MPKRSAYEIAQEMYENDLVKKQKTKHTAPDAAAAAPKSTRKRSTTTIVAKTPTSANSNKKKSTPARKTPSSGSTRKPPAARRESTGAARATRGRKEAVFLQNDASESEDDDDDEGENMRVGVVKQEKTNSPPAIQPPADTSHDDIAFHFESDEEDAEEEAMEEDVVVPPAEEEQDEEQDDDEELLVAPEASAAPPVFPPQQQEQAVAPPPAVAAPAAFQHVYYYQEPPEVVPRQNYLAAAPLAPPRFVNPLPPPPPGPHRRPYYAPGLQVVRAALAPPVEEVDDYNDDDDDLPLAPVMVPDVVYEEDPAVAAEEVAVAMEYPKASQLEIAFFWISILMAICSCGAAIYFGSLENNIAIPPPDETTTMIETAATSIATVVSTLQPKCPPGGYCADDGALTACGPHLKVHEGSSSCVLDDDAAAQIRLIDRLLHKYSFEHIRRATAKDENPYFARVEQGRPLYYLSSVTSALNIPGGAADADLLYAANTVQSDQFLVSDGFLVGIHPHRAIHNSFYAYFQVAVRQVVSTMAFVVWSVLVSLLAIYSSWFRQAPWVTVVGTFVGLVVFFAAVRRIKEVRAIKDKERRVIGFIQLANAELYRAAGRVEAEEIFDRVAQQAFPNSRASRDQLKAQVWRHVLREARNDSRIVVTTEEGGNRTFWEWTDPSTPARKQ
jgi:hypothetical protein